MSVPIVSAPALHNPRKGPRRGEWLWDRGQSWVILSTHLWPRQEVACAQASRDWNREQVGKSWGPNLVEGGAILLPVLGLNSDSVSLKAGGGALCPQPAGWVFGNVSYSQSARRRRFRSSALPLLLTEQRSGQEVRHRVCKHSGFSHQRQSQSRVVLMSTLVP